MKRSEKAQKIGSILDDLYPNTPIPLDHTSAYTLLVAVMLSAQTTDKKGKSGNATIIQTSGDTRGNV